MSVNGIEIRAVARAASRNSIGLTVASVRNAAIRTTGIRERNITQRPARIRPANRGSAPAGRLRTYGSQGWARSSETPTPNWNRFVVMTENVIIEAVA